MEDIDTGDVLLPNGDRIGRCTLVNMGHAEALLYIKRRYLEAIRGMKEGREASAKNAAPPEPEEVKPLEMPKLKLPELDL